jgi:hypothetical protein
MTRHRAFSIPSLVAWANPVIADHARRSSAVDVHVVHDTATVDAENMLHRVLDSSSALQEWDAKGKIDGNSLLDEFVTRILAR